MTELPAARPREVLELEGEIHAAFQSLRAKSGAQIADKETRQADRDAFLAIEHQRRALAIRVHRAKGPRARRYRDLLLISMLVSIQYEHLVGRSGRGPALASLSEGLPALSSDKPAGWAEAWGAGAMFELRGTFAHYSHRRNRLAKRLSAAARAGAAAEAERELSRICVSHRIERVGGELMLEVEDQRLPVPESQKRERRPLIAVAAGKVRTAKKGTPSATPMLRRTAGIAAAALLVGAVVAGLARSGPSDSDGALSRVSGGVPERPLAPLGDTTQLRERSRDLQLARRKAKQAARDRARANRRQRREAARARYASSPADQNAPTESSEPSLTPVPTPAASPPKSTPAKSTPPKSTPPKSTPPPKSGPAPAPAPAPAPEPAPAPAPAPLPRAISPPTN